ncbi:MAG: radical SAM protein [Candidatus Omnitrophica bacterium]|nr:B12-binding domain-containing radical SAM protein [Candidatus Omnitrophota bacterium]MDD5079151.1 radical SAM protein [Candidatus Omnitrophota bacterium]
MKKTSLSAVEESIKGASSSPLTADPKKPRFIIIVPPSPQIPTPGREFLLRTPIEGVTFIATVAKNAGFGVEIVDYRTTPVPPEELIAKSGDHAIFALTTFIDGYVFMEDFIRRVKKIDPGNIVILGGPFVSSTPELLMRALPADFAVLGEGELTILELLAALSGKTPEKIPLIDGLAYRENGKIKFTRPRAQINDLDILPALDFSLWPTVAKDRLIEKIGISSSRGCYARCSFCFKAIPEVRQMTPEKFGQDMAAYVRKYGIKYAYINDLTFVIGRTRTVKLCEELRKTGVRWACSTRVENIDDDLLRLMKDCGCDEIWYGIESVDQKVLNANFKNITVEKIERAVEMTNKAGIKVMANFIVGLLGETEESLDQMVRFIETQDIIPCSIKYLTPFPGTPVYQYALEKKLIVDEIEYFRVLGQRKVNCAEDTIVNCTSLAESKLREAFMRIRRISYDRYGPLDWDNGSQTTKKTV